MSRHVKKLRGGRARAVVMTVCPGKPMSKVARETMFALGLAAAKAARVEKK